MSKVYIVLKYFNKYEFDTDLCRVDRVYSDIEGAINRKEYLDRLASKFNESFTTHIIRKTLKGGILNLMKRSIDL